MTEKTIVRDNLMSQEGYSPYCGDDHCKPRTNLLGDRWPRTKFNGKQFICPNCGWESKFPKNFIKRYKQKWKLK